MACRKHSIHVSKYIQFFWFSYNIQTLSYWEPYLIDFLIKRFENKSCVVVFFSYQTKRQLATSSENLVASAQFLVTLATSELQLRALHWGNFMQAPLLPAISIFEQPQPPQTGFEKNSFRKKVC